MQAYLELKLSWELFHKAPDTLSGEERTRLDKVARRQRDIEHCILTSPEAADVVIPASTLEARLGEIRQRYADTSELSADLARLQVTESVLADAVARDLRVEAVLERVAAQAEPVSEVDAEIYFRLHPQAFERPEMRHLRHILLTFETPEQKAKAQATLEQLRPTLATAEDFAAAALRHSQCPTAMQGGQLGLIKPGQLYAELEPVAFALAAQAVSAVAESPMGLHLLRCDKIVPAIRANFAEARARIIEHLTDKRRAAAQKAWLARLSGQPKAVAETAA